MTEWGISSKFQVLNENLRDVESVMKKVKESLPIFFSRMAPSHFFRVGNVSRKMSLSAINNAVILCVSAIGSANAFVDSVKKVIILFRALS